MPLQGQLGSGIRFAYRVGSPGTFVEVNQILEGDPPQFERDRVETTVHGVVTIRKYTPGLADVSDTRLLLLTDLERSTSPSHLGLKDLERDQTLVWCRFAVPIQADLATCDYFTYEFQGRVSKWGLVTPIDAAKNTEVIFQFGGDDVYTYEALAHAAVFS